MKDLLILFLILFVACKSPSNKEEKLESIALEKLQTNIDSLFNSKIGKNEPGAALLVSYDGKMLIGKGYGLRDLESNELIIINTNMRMASVSKQFTALSILSLVDKGLLSLNDSINKFWPYPVFKNITVQHLLNHTSGLADYTAAFSTDWDKTIVVENKDILEWLSTNPKPLFNAGERFEYCNTAYLVLALLAEKISGIEFSTFAKENIFEKAGMKNTNYYNLASPITLVERAYCYDKDSLDNWKKVDGYFMNGVLGDGAVYTSINDYFSYDKSLRNKSILSEGMHNNIFKPSSMPLTDEQKHKYDLLPDAEESYAMGWFVFENIAFHTGSWIGTNTIVFREFERPLTIAIFLNFTSSSTRTELIESTFNSVDEYIKSTANIK